MSRWLAGWILDCGEGRCDYYALYGGGESVDRVENGCCSLYGWVEEIFLDVGDVEVEGGCGVDYCVEGGI